MDNGSQFRGEKITHPEVVVTGQQMKLSPAVNKRTNSRQHPNRYPGDGTAVFQPKIEQIAEEPDCRTGSFEVGQE